MRNLTDRQRETLEQIRAYIRRNRFPPLAKGALRGPRADPPVVGGRSPERVADQGPDRIKARCETRDTSARRSGRRSATHRPRGANRGNRRRRADRGREQNRRPDTGNRGGTVSAGAGLLPHRARRQHGSHGASRRRRGRSPGDTRCEERGRGGGTVRRRGDAQALRAARHAARGNSDPTATTRRTCPSRSTWRNTSCTSTWSRSGRSLGGWERRSKREREARGSLRGDQPSRSSAMSRTRSSSSRTGARSSAARRAASPVR